MGCRMRLTASENNLSAAESVVLPIVFLDWGQQVEILLIGEPIFEEVFAAPWSRP
jgi:hypothetical protein